MNGEPTRFLDSFWMTAEEIVLIGGESRGFS
jgi:hypothetical protein